MLQKIQNVLQHVLQPLRPLQTYRKRLLVACHDIVLSGGLLRFERVGTVLRAWGHEVAYTVLSDTPSAQRPSALPVLSYDEAAALCWDAVMVPGAGFPDSTIDKFGAFHAANFGIRIQHILNDQTRRHAFKKVNAVCAPHVVIFNNHHWPVGSFTDFHADRFHFLLGAVDPVAFKPAAYRSCPLTAGRWVIGGQAGKNPEPLVEALKYLPPNVILRLFGLDYWHLAESRRDLIKAGRLELVGPLHGSELPAYYHGVDCVVMTETFAGWANLAAEAMASGVPVLCTPHGTGAFARDNETALVIATPTSTKIADGVQRLMNSPSLCLRLAARGREIISGFTWENYAQELLRLVPHDRHRHYIQAPEMGLHGKWSVAERLRGLEPLLEQAHGMSVVDFGAAEGVVGLAFLQRGADCVHGFQVDAHRVSIANGLCQAWAGTHYRQADLSDWKNFYSANADLLRDAYDIVLYLGLHHHLPAESRLSTLKQALGLARRYFAIRTPLQPYEIEPIHELIEEAGFALIHWDNTAHPKQLAGVRIYKKIQTGCYR